MNLPARRGGKLTDVEEYAGAYGGRIADEADETNPTVSVLRHADRPTVDWAAHHWDQVNPDDFEWNLGKRGMDVRHIETGETLRIELGHPLLGHEAESRIRCFCVRGGRLILLAAIPERQAHQPYAARGAVLQPWEVPAPTRSDDGSLKIW